MTIDVELGRKATKKNKQKNCTQKSNHFIFTLVNVYVDLVVFMRIASTSYTRSGRYWC